MTLAARAEAALAAALPRRIGRVCGVVGLQVQVEGIEAAVGDALRLFPDSGPVDAEVVAVKGAQVVCMPFAPVTGIRFGTVVEALGRPMTLHVGPGLLGRVVDGLGRPIDGLGRPWDVEEVSIHAEPPHPLLRQSVDRQMSLGVRAIDTLVPCGKGQRIGIFAGSGVGKSTLLSMMARGSEAPVSVVALVGERGREVNEFIRSDLGEEGLARSVVVVATSDEPALVRIRAAFTATRIAEWFRDQGEDVLLMMDSVTRLAMAQREVGLSVGEPPATRGYPPSVFALMPRLLERAGAGERGSITGLYTVLVDGDDMNEPVADTVRSILDGHIVLSRKLATEGHFPSIDVLESISRVERAVTSPEQRAAAGEMRRLLAAYREARDLIEIGAYAWGSNPVVDRAVNLRDTMNAFLRQDVDDVAPAEVSWRALQTVVGG